jgi:hypothetical protein
VKPMVSAQERTNDLMQQLIETMQQPTQPVYTMPVFERHSDTVQRVELEVEAGIAKRDKPSPQLQQALDYLAAHPDQYPLSSRDLAALVGVSHSWVAKAKKLMEGRE